MEDYNGNYCVSSMSQNTINNSNHLGSIGYF